jgi:acetoin utilization protein AcuC
MQAGLAPGQIRAGLRRFKLVLPIFELFVSRMGHDLFLIEPFAYHNAITFERYGFGYIAGRHAMEAINRDFRPGGPLHARLDGSTPFRSYDAWRTVRLRSWAIHDGILGQPLTGLQMVKHLGVHANVHTFPDGDW